MSISANFRQQFDIARKAAEQLQKFRPNIRIQRSVFDEVFSPIKEIIDQNEMMRQFMSPEGVSLADQMSELRKMCLEAQVSHATDDPLLKQHRTELLNALQGVYESVREANENSLFIEVDFDDFFKMTERLQEIRSAARIHGEFLKHDHVSEALNQVSENIKYAQANLWQPTAAPQAALEDA